VKVVYDQQTLGEYEFDGLGRQISKTAGGTTWHFYYSSQWQVLVGAAGDGHQCRAAVLWGPGTSTNCCCGNRNADANSQTGNLGLSGSGLEEAALCPAGRQLQRSRPGPTRAGRSRSGTGIWATAGRGSFRAGTPLGDVELRLGPPLHGPPPRSRHPPLRPTAPAPTITP